MTPVQGCGSWCLLSSPGLERNSWAQVQVENIGVGLGLLPLLILPQEESDGAVQLLRRLSPHVRQNAVPKILHECSAMQSSKLNSSSGSHQVGEEENRVMGPA